jgi:hypothetical protein
MTPKQRLEFVQLLKKSKVENKPMTINDIANQIGISLVEAKQPWYRNCEVTCMFEYDSTINVYLKDGKRK